MKAISILIHIANLSVLIAWLVPYMLYRYIFFKPYKLNFTEPRNSFERFDWEIENWVEKNRQKIDVTEQ